MGKKLAPERALQAVQRLDAHGIGTQCTFVVGFPGECAASLERTAQFISAMPSGESARGIHRYYMFRFELVPLCPAATPERRAEFGLTGIGEAWAHNTMNADEAREAMRTIFLAAEGPSHTYVERAPQEWTVAAARRVMELRDRLQKQRLRAGGEVDLRPLLAAVRDAEPKSAEA